MVVVPIFIGGTLRGVVQVLYRQPYAFGARELDRLAAAAEMVSLQIRVSAEEPLECESSVRGRIALQPGRPYSTVLLMAAFLLFTILVIRPGYVEHLRALTRALTGANSVLTE